MTHKELIKKLNQVRDLSSGGNPNSVWVASNKEILMSQIKPNSQNESPVATSSERIYYFEYFNNLFRQSILKPATAFMIIVFVLLGYSATVSVAGDSLPGDMFYPIKTAREKVQLAFTFEEGEKVMLQMAFVSNRADELQQLIRTTDNTARSKAAVKKTAQQIVKDVKDVKDQLNKISLAAVSLVDVAKEIDTKTLEVKQSLTAAHDGLSTEIKNEVSDDLKEAIVTTEEAGTSALNVIIKKYESGEMKIADSEVTSRVADRIKDAEGNISGAIQTVQNASSTQVTIGQAKNLLDQKSFSLALEKITETNQIVNTSTSTSTSTPTQ